PEKHELQQKNLENYGVAYGLSYSISETKHDEIKYDLEIGTEGWETEGDEAHQNDNLIGQKTNSESKASEAPDSFIVINTVDIYRKLRSRKDEINKLKIFEESTAKEQEVVNVICRAKGTMQVDTKVENSIKNKDSILEFELFRTSGKISKKGSATSELENASLIDDGFEKALNENLEINIKEMKDNKSTNTRNKLTSKVREENEADDLVFELHLNRSLERQNFGKK
ncbi:hypothetical protein WUBG_17683, partial [Wuchereria bancrofti]